MQETKQFFVRLCGNRAENALAQACKGFMTISQTAAAAQEAAAALHPAGASPSVRGLASAATAEQAEAQMGLSHVKTSIQNILDQLPAQEQVLREEASESALRQTPQRNPDSPISLSSTPSEDMAALVDQRGKSQAHLDSVAKAAYLKTSGSKSRTAYAAAAGKEQVAGVPKLAVDTSPEHIEPSGAVETAAPTATATSPTAVATVPTAADRDVTSSPVPSSVAVVCGDLQGTFDALTTMVLFESGKKPCRPSTFEKRAGKGNGKTWPETIKVDHSNKLLAVPIGKWWRNYKRACGKTISSKRQPAVAQRAKHGSASAVIAADGSVQLTEQDAHTPPSSVAQLARSGLKHVSSLLLVLYDLPTLVTTRLAVIQVQQPRCCHCFMSSFAAGGSTDHNPFALVAAFGCGTLTGSAAGPFAVDAALKA